VGGGPVGGGSVGGGSVGSDDCVGIGIVSRLDRVVAQIVAPSTNNTRNVATAM
jgi:hypothetical protein